MFIEILQFLLFFTKHIIKLKVFYTNFNLYNMVVTKPYGAAGILPLVSASSALVSCSALGVAYYLQAPK